MVDIMSGNHFMLNIDGVKYRAKIENRTLSIIGLNALNILFRDTGHWVLDIGNDKALIHVASYSIKPGYGGSIDTAAICDIEYNYIVYPYSEDAEYNVISLNCDEARYCLHVCMNTLNSVRELYRLYHAASVVIGDRIILNTAELSGDNNSSTVYFGNANIKCDIRFRQYRKCYNFYDNIYNYMEKSDNFDNAVELFMSTFYLTGKAQFMILCAAFDGLAGELLGFKNSKGRYKKTYDFLEEVRNSCSTCITQKDNKRLAELRNKYFHGENLNTRHSYYDIEAMKYLIYNVIAKKIEVSATVITPYDTESAVKQIKEQYKAGGSLKDFV